MGNRDRWRAPQGLYRCQGDRWLAISVGDDEEWVALATQLGGAELAGDPRFADADSRRANHDDLDEIIGKWAADQEVLDAFHRLQEHGVPAGPLFDNRMFCEDPQVIDRGWLQPLTTTDVGSHLHAGLPYRGVPHVWRRGSPGLGEDNDYVYKTILGVSDEDYERYRAQNILAEDYLSPQGEPL
jgi:benzylsuccinate CoA-transferase BbsF subunit/naphthyl-2-methylsuccinate CoA transferase subunit